jgi:hypothetical protein
MRDRRDWIPACAGMTNKIKQIHCFVKNQGAHQWAECVHTA